MKIKNNLKVPLYVTVEGIPGYLTRIEKIEPHSISQDFPALEQYDEQIISVGHPPDYPE